MFCVLSHFKKKSPKSRYWLSLRDIEEFENTDAVSSDYTIEDITQFKSFYDSMRSTPHAVKILAYQAVTGENGTVTLAIYGSKEDAELVKEHASQFASKRTELLQRVDLELTINRIELDNKDFARIMTLSYEGLLSEFF